MLIVRVIAGEARGHKLDTLKGNATRPTMDKVKGAIFNIIAPDVCDSCVLDLFAGSGALGIEALSRGAQSTVFVDRSRESIGIVRKNLEHTKLDKKSIVMNCDAFEAVLRLKERELKFDIIFIDPPYNKKIAQKALIFLESNGILKDSGIIIVEHSKDDEMPDDVERLKRVKFRQYGSTVISFYQYMKKE